LVEGLQHQNPLLVINGSQSIGASYATTAAPTNGLIVQGNVGIGTSSPTVALDINGSIGIADGQWIRQNGMSAGGFRYSGNNILFYNSSNNSIFIIPTGSTSTTVAFAGLTATSISVTRTYNHTSSTSNGISFTNTFSPTSGTGIYNDLIINPTINQTGGANGITRGLYINPTLTAAADWRSIEWSNNSGYGIYGAGTANNYVAGNFGFQQISPTAIADFGASTTTRSSLRIRSGTAPTSPNDGDIWYDGADFYGRVGTTTKSFTAGGGGGVTVSSYTPTVTTVTNVSSATIDHSSVYYISYNGEAYEVWGQVTMTPTVALTTTGFRITLPVLSGGGIYPEILSGSFTSSDGAVGRIYFGYPTDAAYFESVPPSSISRTYSFRFIYKVIPL